MDSQGDEGHPAAATVLESAVLDAAVLVIAEHGSAGLTLARLATAADTSRMTLHRKGFTIHGVLLGLRARAAAELKEALFDPLTSTAPAVDRLAQALTATFDVADRHLPVLAGLFAADTGVFHAAAGPDGALPTAQGFVAPFAKLLSDGGADGTLRRVDDPEEAAAVLFNTAGWGYVQLRHSQRWPAARARRGVIDLVMTGLVA